MTDPVRFEAVHCIITIDRPARDLVLVTFEGHDVGELGDAPFRELSADVAAGRSLELFIDARRARTASVAVSGAWAQWLAVHKDRFRRVCMLTGGRFIQLSAELVRQFADLGDTMRLYSDPAAFDADLAASLEETTSAVRFEGSHCVITVRRPAPRVLMVTLDGHDVGELGDRPFREMEQDLAQGQAELFIDARHGKAASVGVSGAWAHWLAAHRTRFRHISMLTGSRFIHISADFVRRFAGLGETMRLYSDSTSFDEMVAASIAAARSGPKGMHE